MHAIIYSNSEGQMSKKDRKKTQHYHQKPGAKKSVSARKAQQKTPQWVWIAGGALLIALLAFGIWSISRPKPDSQAREGVEISVAEAYEKYQAGIFLLDVRTQEEWEDYHAPNTTLIPLDELPDRVNELPKDQEIVVVCRSGNRSQEGRDILLKAGFTNVSSMAGGLNEWRDAGYPTVSGP